MLTVYWSGLRNNACYFGYVKLLWYGDGDDDDGRGLVVMVDVCDVCLDHVSMRLAVVADDYELLATDVTFYDCIVHTSYVL